ncbi:hypothetical protein A1O1_02151 [Capronia coronata CBS 617.96]|uniref:Xylanolytic transcriptional activator regulatory domain-containing protein n=1 Tax=Capronia coronata CBS 617.96 TaxID=1182541 RepID=W9YMG3_9EURO|nr:uncharacterized protein A1O1_02151 [Capronia coronata CBS 617.96]EXJ93758.1 hypothetical protein A1O1_02151 [Capronia coronata CBS 617.96]
MFRAFMERFENNANKPSPGRLATEPASTTNQAVESIEPELPTSGDSRLLDQDRDRDRDRLPPSHQQSGLDQRNDPDGEDNASGRLESNGDDEAISTEAERRVIHADSFGELDMDENGELRYIGLGSMTAIIDTCIGLRRHIYSGLEKKGYLRIDSTLSSPRASNALGDPQTPGHHSLVLQIPQAALVNILIGTWERNLWTLFPVVRPDELRALYAELQVPDRFDIGSTAILFAVLAVCVPTARKVHGSAVEGYLMDYGDDPSSQFYNTAKHFVDMPQSTPQGSRRRNSKVLIALGLMSMYLTQVGSEAEAWMTVGRAIRLGQDLGFHRSPGKLRLPSDEAQARRRIFWALYILERQLSGALGRPLAINDEDCDVELPDADADADPALQGFSAMAHLHKIIGNILRTVASVKNAQTWQDSERYEELRSRVLSLNQQLRQWSTENVAQTIKDAQSDGTLVYRHIALSSFFSAVLNLHRLYMSNPHRTSPLENSQALLQCSKAATSCIRGTSTFLSCVPTSHYTLLHGHHCFLSATVLLHCIRANAEPAFAQTALADVEEAVRCLRSLEPTWPGAEKCRGIVEEYVEFTLNVLQNGKRGQCCFSHDHHDHLAHDGSCNLMPPSAARRPPVDPLRRHMGHQPPAATLKRKRSTYDPPVAHQFNPPLPPPPPPPRPEPVTVSWLSSQSDVTPPAAPPRMVKGGMANYTDFNFEDLDAMLANSHDFSSSAPFNALDFSSMQALPDLGMDFCFPEFPHL